MRTWLLGLLVICVLALVGLPPLLGIVYERQLRDQFAALPFNPYLIVELVAYDRGLYASHGSIRIAFTEDYLELLRRSQAAADQDPALDPESRALLDRLLEGMASDLLFDFHARHGPLLPDSPLFVGLAIVDTEIAATEGPLLELQNWLGTGQLLRSRSRVAFDGSQDFDLMVPAASASTESGQLEFSGLAFRGHFDPAGPSVSTTGGGESLVFDSERIRVELRDLAIDTTSRLRGRYLWLGHGAMALRELNIEAQPRAVNEQFYVDGLGFEFTVDMEPDSDRLNMEAVYHLAGLSGMPGLDLQAAELRLRVAGIDATVAERYVELNQQLALAGPDQLEKAMPELMELANRLLAGSLTVQIDPLRFRLGDEDFNASLRLDYLADKVPVGTTVQALQANPGLLLLALSVAGQLSASKALAEDIAVAMLREQIADNLPPDVQLSPQEIDELALQQAPALLAGMQQQGVLREADGQLSIDFSYRDGQFLVNGQPLALGQMR